MAQFLKKVDIEWGVEKQSLVKLSEIFKAQIFSYAF